MISCLILLEMFMMIDGSLHLYRTVNTTDVPNESNAQCAGIHLVNGIFVIQQASCLQPTLAMCEYVPGRLKFRLLKNIASRLVANIVGGYFNSMNSQTACIQYCLAKEGVKAIAVNDVSCVCLNASEKEIHGKIDDPVICNEPIPCSGVVTQICSCLRQTKNGPYFGWHIAYITQGMNPIHNALCLIKNLLKAVRDLEFSVNYSPQYILITMFTNVGFWLFVLSQNIFFQLINFVN